MMRLPNPIRLAPGVGLIALAACGGSGSNMVQPLSGSGFAQSQDVITGGTTFSVPSAKVNRQQDVSNSGVPDIIEQDVTVSILEDGTKIRLTLDDETFELSSTGTGGFYAADVDSRRVFLRRELFSSDIVETVAIGVFDSQGSDSFGYLTFGFDTDPDRIGVINGQAAYAGELVAVVEGRSRFGMADGTFSMVVDFDTTAISGDLFLVDDGVATGGLTIPTTQLSLKDTTLSQNQFSGSLTGTLSGGAFTGVSIRDAKVEGRFFGPFGSSIGGGFSAELEDTFGADAYAIQGGFNGSQ